MGWLPLRFGRKWTYWIFMIVCVYITLLYYRSRQVYWKAEGVCWLSRRDVCLCLHVEGTERSGSVAHSLRHHHWLSLLVIHNFEQVDLIGTFFDLIIIIIQLPRVMLHGLSCIVQVYSESIPDLICVNQIEYYYHYYNDPSSIKYPRFCFGLGSWINVWSAA